MGKTKPPYPEAFKQQIVELAMAGRTPAELSREFGVAAQSITAWVARSAADRGTPVRGKDVLSTAEREELARLRRQVRQLQQERDLAVLRQAGVVGLDPGGGQQVGEHGLVLVGTLAQVDGGEMEAEHPHRADQRLQARGRQRRAEVRRQ